MACHFLFKILQNKIGVFATFLKNLKNPPCFVYLKLFGVRLLVVSLWALIIWWVMALTRLVCAFVLLKTAWQYRFPRLFRSKFLSSQQGDTSVVPVTPHVRFDCETTKPLVPLHCSALHGALNSCPRYVVSHLGAEYLQYGVAQYGVILCRTKSGFDL